MDRKAVIVLAVCFGLLMLWYPLMNRMYPPAQTAPGEGTNQLAAATNRAGSVQDPQTAAVEFPSFADQVEMSSKPDVAEKLVSVLRGPVRFTFTSWGGGLKLIELLEYPDATSCGKESADTGFSEVASLNTQAPTPILSFPNQPLLQGDGVYELTSAAGIVRASKQLTNGLRVIKEFRPGTNYIFGASVRLENGSGRPITLPAQELVFGTATPLGTRDDAIHMGVHWFDGEKDTKITGSWFQNRTLGCIPGTPREVYDAGDQNNVLWAAVNNQFFAIAAMVPTNAPSPRVIARKIDLPALPVKQGGSKPKENPGGYQAAFAYAPQILEPGAVLVRHYEIYAGPKEYKTLARIGTRMNNGLAEIMDFGFFGLFSKFLLLSMNGLHNLGIGYGLAIVVITVIIKLIFWPLTKASTRSMKRMSALQPQMKALQEKYKEDPRKMNQKLMEFMKENKVNPMGGCLPMLLQIPVFIGFFYMIKSAIELRGASFLWACDLSQPDTIFVIPGLGFPVNPFPLLMGATQLWQMRLTPPSPGMDPMQQKILQYMPLMFMFILYNFSSGLTLYWTVQNLLSVVQMKLTRNEPVRPIAPAKAKAKPEAVGPGSLSKSPRPKKKNRKP